MLNIISKYLFYICIIAVQYLATTTREIEVVQNSWDKANHFVAFMVLFVLLSFGYKYLNLAKKIMILSLFAVQIEIVQYFIPCRSFSLLDIFADMVGVGIGYVVARGLMVDLVGLKGRCESFSIEEIINQTYQTK